MFSIFIFKNRDFYQPWAISFADRLWCSCPMDIFGFCTQQLYSLYFTMLYQVQRLQFFLPADHSPRFSTSSTR